MRSLALIFAAVLSVLLLLVAFQNVTNDARVVMLLGEVRAPLFLPLLLMAVGGMVAGALYAISIRGMIDHAKKLEEEANEPDPF